MINIQQDSVVPEKISDILNTCGDTEIQLSPTMIKDDLARLKAEHLKPLNNIDKRNIEILIAYLERLKSRIKFDGYQFNWYYEDGKIKTYPLDLRHYNMYKVKATDYIIIGSKNMVNISYTELLKIIAFDMMFYELDETFESMEDKLGNLGVTAIYDSELLTKYITEPVLYLSKSLRVGKSMYGSTDEKVVYDYFGKKAFKDGKYAGCVGSSIDQALAILTTSVLEKCESLNIEYNLCAVNEDGIYLLVDNLNGTDIQNIFESSIVRAFGRHFEVKPIVTVF